MDGRQNVNGCAIPPATCPRDYCQPAPWSSACGASYHQLSVAYGASVPRC